MVWVRVCVCVFGSVVWFFLVIFFREVYYPSIHTDFSFYFSFFKIHVDDNDLDQNMM